MFKEISWIEAATAADATLGNLNDLGDLIRQGLAFHHAGLPSHLLRQIENLVRQKAIRAVGATTTVAEGADLPFQVVIIPHLNFGTGAARLERNLYENIIGRAGRSNVAIEGLVVTIGSEAPSLRNYVERVLWNEARTNTLQGQMNRGLNTPTNIEEYRVRREIESQVLAWLGDPDSEIEEQGHQLAASTFSWATSSQLQRNLLEQGFDDILEELERSGLARAASPLQLTSLGRRARLAGMGPASCLRLAALVGRLGESKALAAFEGTSEISLDFASIISALAFETEEVIEWSLWFRSLRTRGEQEVQIFRDLTFGALDWPYDDPIFMTDIELLSSWIVGMSYSELAQIPPIFGGRGIFGSSDLGKRSADAALQMGRIAYPSSWAWGAATAIMGEDGEALPTWIRHGIEFGVPTETAVELIRNFGISRASSVALSSVLSPNWSSAEAELLDLGESDLRALGVTEIDRRMLVPSFD